MPNIVAYDIISGGIVKTSGTSFALARTAASGDSAWQNTQYPDTRTNIIGGPTYAIARGVLGFDLSSLAGSVISATVSVYGQSKDEDDGTFSVRLVNGSALAGTIVVADYGDLLAATANCGSISSSAWAIGSFNNINLTGTGLAILSATTVYFGVRTSLDINNTAPTVGLNDVSWLGYGYGNDSYITVTVASGEEAGAIGVVGETFHYVSKTGVEYVVQGTAV